MTSRQSTNRRLDSVQFMRFLAAFLVLITHSGFYVSERLDGNFEYWRRGASGVALFFVISGFVMMLSSEKLIPQPDGWRTFAVRRLVRIVPVYWMATSAKVLAMLFVASQVLHSELDIPTIVKSYFFIPSYNEADNKILPLLGVGWTLVFEMFFYLLLTVALALKLPPLKFAGPIVLLCFLGSFFRDVLFDMRQQPLLYFLLDGVMMEFLFGMILGHLYLKKVFLGQIASVLAIALGMLSIVFDVFRVAFPIPPLVSIGLASFFVIWGCASLEQNSRITIPPVFVFLGSASYTIYLFHPLIVPIVPVAFKKLGLGSPYLATASGVAVALAVSSVIYVVLERPITNFLTARLNRRGLSPA